LVRVAEWVDAIKVDAWTREGASHLLTNKLSSLSKLTYAGFESLPLTAEMDRVVL